MPLHGLTVGSGLLLTSAQGRHIGRQANYVTNGQPSHLP